MINFLKYKKCGLTLIDIVVIIVCSMFAIYIGGAYSQHQKKHKAALELETKQQIEQTVERSVNRSLQRSYLKSIEQKPHKRTPKKNN